MCFEAKNTTSSLKRTHIKGIYTNVSLQREVIAIERSSEQQTLKRKQFLQLFCLVVATVIPNQVKVAWLAISEMNIVLENVIFIFKMMFGTI